jgi:hypothetical protein
VNEPCPECKHPFLVVGGGAKNPKLVCPRGKECGYSRPLDLEAEDGAPAVVSSAATLTSGERPARGERADEEPRARGDEAQPPF